MLVMCLGWFHGRAQAQVTSPPEVSLDLVVAVDRHRRLAPDGRLVQRSLAAVIASLRPGDGFTVFTFAREAPRLLVREITGPADVEPLRRRLGSISFTAPETRLSRGLAVPREAVKKTGTTARRPVFLLVTDGRPSVPAAAHEAEMRARAEVAAAWRTQPGRKIIAGLITHPESHWLLRQLSERMGADLVLVRSTDAAAVQAALASLGRVLQQARRDPPPEREGKHLGPLVAALGGLALLLLLCGLRRRRRKGWQEEEWPGEEDPEGSVREAPPEPRLQVIAGTQPEDGPFEVVDRWQGTFTDLRGNGGCLDLGSDLTDQIFLDHPDIRPHHVTVALEDGRDRLFLEVAPSAAIEAGGKVRRGPFREVLRTRRELRVGPFSVWIERR